eukprot:2088093-Rhodomonas_salina.1
MSIGRVSQVCDHDRPQAQDCVLSSVSEDDERGDDERVEPSNSRRNLPTRIGQRHVLLLVLFVVEGAKLLDIGQGDHRPSG